jgi:hypothetical protein
MYLGSIYISTECRPNLTSNMAARWPSWKKQSAITPEQLNGWIGSKYSSLVYLISMHDKNCSRGLSCSCRLAHGPWTILYIDLLCSPLLSYALHALIRQTNTTNIHANCSKIMQSVLKKFLCVQMKSPTLLIILGWVFLWKYAKMRERNIARPRMPICRVIKISDYTKCWFGESPQCWAAVSRAPEFGRGAAGIARRHIICHVSFIVTSWNSDLNYGALETA